MNELLKVTKSKDGKIYYLEINQPEKRNILSFEIIEKFISIFQNIKEDLNICAVVLSGKGAHFCAGGDLRWLKCDAEKADIENLNETDLLFKVFKDIYDCPVPVIANVQGSVYGGGLGLIAASDIVVADPQSKFCFSELKLGLVPSVISPFVLRKMTRSKAQAYMLSAQVFNAEEALNSGLVHLVDNEDARQAYIHNLLSNLVTFDRQPMQQTKKLIHFVSGKSLEEVTDYCTQLLAERRKDPKVIEKINRFLNRK